MEKLSLTHLSEVSSSDAIELITGSEELFNLLIKRIYEKTQQRVFEEGDWVKKWQIMDRCSVLIDMLKGETPDYLFCADELMSYIKDDIENSTMWTNMEEVYDLRIIA